MKIKYLFLCIIMWGGVLKAQPILRFVQKEHDFGRMNMQDGEVTCYFRFHNEGDIPLVLQKTETTCGCTRIQFSKKPVMPGQTDSLRVTYNPRKQEPGAFLKTIKVFSNASSAPLILIIRGE